jgi:predicted oxidoreductase
MPESGIAGLKAARDLVDAGVSVVILVPFDFHFNLCGSAPIQFFCL